MHYFLIMTKRLLASCYAFNNNLHNFNRNPLRNILHMIYREYGSALHISGRQANKQFAFLNPYLDFDKCFRDFDKLQQELKLRKVDMKVLELKQGWELYKKLQTDMLLLENKYKDIGNKIKLLLTKEKVTAMDIQIVEDLKSEIKTIKKDIKILKEMQWDLDESIIIKLLKLPNELHEKTPDKLPMVLKSVGKPNNSTTNKNKSHIEIGKTLDLLEYKDPMCYYLTNNAALFEFGILNLAGILLANNKVIRIAGSDLCRSILVEASGLDHENFMDSFILENTDDSSKSITANNLHLVGGASIQSMLAIHTKQIFDSTYLPIKYYSVGRHYTPVPKDVPSLGLFNVCQASSVEIMLILKDSESKDSMDQLQEMVEIVCRLYDNITKHYRVVMRPASELRNSEKMRISFELWSPFFERYVEAGHISVYGQYFSQRLLIEHDRTTAGMFPSIVSGLILSVPRVLGCLLEQNPSEFIIPSKIVKHLPCLSHSSKESNK